MIYTPVTKKAMKIAFEAHSGMTDKSGLPYIMHPLHLAESMTDETTTAVALLHDVIEDTDITAQMLLEMGMPEDVVNGVLAMTHGADEEYFDYIERIKKNPQAVKVKLADLAHNSDMSRLDVITQKDIQRVEKYKKAIEILSAE